jgi:hypothetical protein
MCTYVDFISSETSDLVIKDDKNTTIVLLLCTVYNLQLQNTIQYILVPNLGTVAFCTVSVYMHTLLREHSNTVIVCVPILLARMKESCC